MQDDTRWCLEVWPPSVSKGFRLGLAFSIEGLGSQDIDSSKLIVAKFD